MGWETTPKTKGLFMDTIKLERNGKIVTRSKADYEMNIILKDSSRVLIGNSIINYYNRKMKIVER